MSTRNLSAREVEHVAEEPADRRAQDMQDIEAAVRSVRHVEIHDFLTLRAPSHEPAAIPPFRMRKKLSAVRS
jgi:hypothetical protein